MTLPKVHPLLVKEWEKMLTTTVLIKNIDPNVDTDNYHDAYSDVDPNIDFDIYPDDNHNTYYGAFAGNESEEDKHLDKFNAYYDTTTFEGGDNVDSTIENDAIKGVNADDGIKGVVGDTSDYNNGDNDDDEDIIKLTPAIPHTRPLTTPFRFF